VKGRFIAVIKYILVLGIGVGMLWLAFSGVRLKDTIHEIMQANFFWLFMSILTSLVAFYSRALRWNLLIEPLGYKPSAANTTAALMIGYLANLAVPRLGEVTRCGTLSRVEKIPFNSLLGTVIIERIIDVISLLICILLVAINEYSRLGNFLNENIYVPFISKFSTVLNHPFITFVASLVLIGIIYLVFRRKNKEGGITGKIAALGKGIVDGINTIRKMKSPVAFILHTILIWTMYFLMTYLCFSALEATASLDWHAGLFVLVVGGMGMSAPVQGGIGAYHLLVSQGLILYGVSLEHGLTFATLMHTSQTLVVILFGGLSFLYLFLKKRNAKAEHT
jgi:uncharacterized protein (TIRG00374 family)